MDNSILVHSTLHDIRFDSESVITGDTLVPPLDILTNQIAKEEERCKDWERLNTKCHGLFGRDPSYVPQPSFLSSEQSALMTELTVFAYCQEDSFSRLARLWFGNEELLEIEATVAVDAVMETQNIGTTFLKWMLTMFRAA